MTTVWIPTTMWEHLSSTMLQARTTHPFLVCAPTNQGPTPHLGPILSMHTQHMAYLYVLGMVDVFPVYVPAAHDFAVRQLLYQPKYDACVLKDTTWHLLLGQHYLMDRPAFRNHI